MDCKHSSFRGTVPCIVGVIGLGLLATTIGCSETHQPPGSISIAISPASAELGPGEALPFSATVSGTRQNGVTWMVAEREGAVIDLRGRFVAELAGTYQVVARSLADPSKSAIATVNVNLLISVNPPTTTVRRRESVVLSASVRGAR